MPVQRVFDTFNGVPRVEPLSVEPLVMRALVDNNMPVAAAMPLPVMGGAPPVIEAHVVRVERGPVLACAVRMQ